MYSRLVEHLEPKLQNQLTILLLSLGRAEASHAPKPLLRFPRIPCTFPLWMGSFLPWTVHPSSFSSKDNGVVRAASQNRYYHLNDSSSHPWVLMTRSLVRVECINQLSNACFSNDTWLKPLDKALRGEDITDFWSEADQGLQLFSLCTHYIF